MSFVFGYCVLLHTISRETSFPGSVLCLSCRYRRPREAEEKEPCLSMLDWFKTQLYTKGLPGVLIFVIFHSLVTLNVFVAYMHIKVDHAVEKVRVGSRLN